MRFCLLQTSVVGELHLKLVLHRSQIIQKRRQVVNVKIEGASCIEPARFQAQEGRHSLPALFCGHLEIRGA